MLGGIWILAMIVTLPELTAVWPERKVVRQTFSSYADTVGRRSNDFKNLNTGDTGNHGVRLPSVFRFAGRLKPGLFVGAWRQG